MACGDLDCSKDMVDFERTNTQKEGFGEDGCLIWILRRERLSFGVFSGKRWTSYNYV